ncbi:ABC transporter, partial [Tropilaelaps mercedesae]
LGMYRNCYPHLLLEKTSLINGIIKPGYVHLAFHLILGMTLLCLTKCRRNRDSSFECTQYSQQRVMYWTFKVSSLGKHFAVVKRQEHTRDEQKAQLGTKILPQLAIEAPDSQSAASINDVTVTWNGNNVLNNFSLDLTLDCVTALVSESSTFSGVLISVLTRNIQNYMGTVTFHGDDEQLKRASVCTAEPILFNNLTVLDNFRILNGMARLAELDLIAQELLANVNLLHLIMSKIRALTKVQRKLIGIIIALSSPSVVTILEEPLRGISQEDLHLVIMSQLDKYREHLASKFNVSRLQLDKEIILKMLVVVFVAANSYYFIVVNHTPFVYRHLYFSGLSKIAYFSATYLVLVLINYCIMMLFLVLPAWLGFTIRQHAAGAPYQLVNLYGPYLIFIMLASSAFTLSSIAIGILLPKWVSFLHIFIILFCANVCHIAPYLYRVSLTPIVQRVASAIIPSCAIYDVIHTLEQQQLFEAICLDPIVKTVLCPWNPYGMRPCCEEESLHITFPESLLDPTGLYYLYCIILDRKLLDVLIIIVANKWRTICYMWPPMKRRINKATKELQEYKKHNIIMTRKNVDKTILRETAVFTKGSLDRFLREGSVVFKDACLDIRYSKRPLLNLVIEPRSCFGILGLRGAGKSCVLKIIRGELNLDFGEVYVNGVLKCHPSKIGYFSKSIELPLMLQSIELLLIHAELRKVPCPIRHETVVTLASIFGLSNSLRTIIIATDTLDDFEHFAFDKTLLMVNGKVTMILNSKQLEAHMWRGYSITIKVNYLLATDDLSGNRSISTASERRQQLRMRDLMKPIRDWMQHKLSKAVPVVDAGAVLELHIVDDSVAMPELFTLRDFICKQFNYISEFRIAHLSNQERLRHLIYNTGVGEPLRSVRSGLESPISSPEGSMASITLSEP